MREVIEDVSAEKARSFGDDSCDADEIPSLWITVDKMRHCPFQIKTMVKTECGVYLSIGPHIGVKSNYCVGFTDKTKCPLHAHLNVIVSSYKPEDAKRIRAEALANE